MSNLVRNYSPHLAPNTLAAPPTAELRKILGMAAREMLLSFLKKSRTRRSLSKGKGGKSTGNAIDIVSARTFIIVNYWIAFEGHWYCSCEIVRGIWTDPRPLCPSSRTEWRISSWSWTNFENTGTVQCFMYAIEAARRWSQNAWCSIKVSARSYVCFHTVNLFILCLGWLKAYG